jgi:glycosyltransferase involved in cell wall biosynthesis
MLLYLHPHFTHPGGGSRFVLETAERLAKKGMEPTVLTQSANRKIIKDYNNIKFSFLGGSLPSTISYWLKNFNLSKKIAQKIDKLKPDIIFPQVFPANHWGFIYKKNNKKIKCIWMCQEPSAFIHDKTVIDGLNFPMRWLAKISNPFFKRIDINLVKYADEIITNSRFTSGNVKRIYKRNSIPISGLGVDIKKFKPTKNKENFIFVASRLTKFKKVDVAIKAMKYLKDYKDLNLYIGAGGEEEENLRKLAKDIKVEDKVNFLGWVSQKELSYYYSKAAVVLFMSVNEPCGLVPLEAMASGTPTIATNTGGPKETIIDGKTGFLVKPNNPVAVSNKIKILLENKKMLRRMSRDARKHVEKNFTWDAVVDRLYNVFRNY